jgi:hypothetical protein
MICGKGSVSRLLPERQDVIPDLIRDGTGFVCPAFQADVERMAFSASRAALAYGYENIALPSFYTSR